MVEVLQRYRVLIIVLSILLFAIMLWLFISRQETGRIPSRGVFV